MRKNWKKVLSLVLALAMVFSMNTTAFAAGGIVAVADDGVIAEEAAAADVIDNTSDAELPAAADTESLEPVGDDDPYGETALKDAGWTVTSANGLEGIDFGGYVSYNEASTTLTISGSAVAYESFTVLISANANPAVKKLTVSADGEFTKSLSLVVSGANASYIYVSGSGEAALATESEDVRARRDYGADKAPWLTLYAVEKTEAQPEPLYAEDAIALGDVDDIWAKEDPDVHSAPLADDKWTVSSNNFYGKVAIIAYKNGSYGWYKVPEKADSPDEDIDLIRSGDNLSVNGVLYNDRQYALTTKSVATISDNDIIVCVSADESGHAYFSSEDLDTSLTYYLTVRSTEENKFYSDWKNTGATGKKFPRSVSDDFSISVKETLAKSFTFDASDAPTDLKYVVVSHNALVDSASVNGITETVWTQVEKTDNVVTKAVTFDADGTLHTNVDIVPSTIYDIYVVYFDDTTKDTLPVTKDGWFVETLAMKAASLTIGSVDNIKYGDSAVDNISANLTVDPESLKDEVLYRFSKNASDLAGSAKAPGLGGTISDGSAPLAPGNYFAVAYLNGLDPTGYNPENVSSNMVSFQVLSVNAYGSVSVANLPGSNLSYDEEKGEYLIDAGKTIEYGDLATVFFDEDGEVIPGLDWKTGSEAQYIIKNKKGELLGILKKGGAPVTVSGSGVLDITISKNGAGELTDSNYEYKGEREASIVIRVIDPDLQIEAVVAEIPFGYSVAGHQPGSFDIRNFVKVTDKNDNGNDLTNSVTYTVSTNSNPTGLSVENFVGSHKAVVGETVYVTARYKTGTPVVLASGALKVGKQTAKVVFNEVHWTWSVSESMLPYAYINRIALFDEKGEIGAYDAHTEYYVHSDYTGGISLKGYDLNNRDAYNKYQYFEEPLKLAVNVSANSTLSANDYDFSVSECEIRIKPTRIVHAEQLGIVSNSHDYIDQLRDNWTAVLEKLSANDLKKLAEKLFGSSEVYEKAELVVTAELVYDGSDINHSGSVPERLESYEYVIGEDGNSKFHLRDFDYQYIKDVKLNFQFIEQKYDPNDTANLTMGSIDDVTYDGFKHVAWEAGDNKSQTADLNVNVYSDGRRLVYGTDYKLTYKNNVNACEDYTKVDAKKMPTVIVTGLGNYKGMEYIAYFNIKKADVNTIFQSGGLKYYYKANKNGAFTIKPKFVTDSNNWWSGYSKAVDIKKEKITFRAVSANVENPLKANAVVADGTKGKGTLPGDKAMKLTLIAKVSGGTNFKDGETILDEFYVLPAKGGAVTAKFNSKKQATINWSTTKTSVSVADFVGKDLANLKITTKAKGVTVSAADFGDPSFGYFVDSKEGWGGDETNQVGAYEIYLIPTEKAVLEKNIAPDTVKVKVTFKATEKLSKLKSQFSMSSYKVYDGASWNEAKAYDKKAGITLPDPAYGAQVSINAPKTLKNDLTADLMNAKGNGSINKQNIVSNNGLQDWLNGAANNAIATYKIIIEGSGAYSVKEKVTLTYKIAPFKADDVKIRVISANYGTATDPVYKNGEIFFNKGGYVFAYDDWRNRAYDTDVFGHVNMTLQTKDKDGKFVDNDDLTDYLKNSKVKITTDKNGAVNVTVTGIKNDQGKVVVKGAVKNLVEAMTAKASLSNNDSIVVVNKGLTTDKASKYAKSIVLEQYSAAKGVDAEGNYKTVKLTNKEYSMTGTFAQGLSANNATFTGTGSFSGDKKVSGNDVTLSFLDRYGVAVGEKAITKGFKFNAATITGSAKSLTYKNGLRVMPEKFTIQGKGGQGNIEITTASANNLDLEEGGQYVKDLGVKVFVKFANNRDISNKAQATIYFVPVDSTAKYIGSKTVKFKITK